MNRFLVWLSVVATLLSLGFTFGWLLDWALWQTSYDYVYAPGRFRTSGLRFGSVLGASAALILTRQGLAVRAKELVLGAIWGVLATSVIGLLGGAAGALAAKSGLLLESHDSLAPPARIWFCDCLWRGTFAGAILGSIVFVCRAGGFRASICRLWSSGSQNHSSESSPPSRHSLKTIIVAAHAWYGDTIGGSFRLASDVAQHFATRGYRVVYICCSNTVAQVVRSQESGVEVWRYPPPERGWLRLFNIWHHERHSRSIAKQILSSSRVVLVNGHSPLQYRGVLQAVKDQRHQVHSCYTVHSPFDEELLAHKSSRRGSWKSRIAAFVARRLEQSNVCNSVIVQVLSNYTRRVLADKFGKEATSRMVVVPGWVEMQPFAQVPGRASSRSELSPPWNTTDPIFFTLRRLEPRMGVDTLVLAAARLKAQGKPFRVLIGGDGSQKVPLQQLVAKHGLEEHVQFLGRVPESLLSRCYAAADCFVLPTRALECFGLIVLESFAASTPVIASRNGAIPEIAGRQGEDWLFDPGNDEQLAQRMGRLLSGELKVTVPLRTIAEEFDRSRVLTEWERACFPASKITA